MRNTDAALDHEIGSPIVIKGKRYTVVAVDGDDVLLDPA